MSTRAQLVDELLKLPAPDRAEAARTLLASLDADDDPDAVASAWEREIASRVSEIEAGSVALEEGNAVMRTLRARAEARLARRKP